jgi:hypothetical protein
MLKNSGFLLIPFQTYIFLKRTYIWYKPLPKASAFEIMNAISIIEFWRFEDPKIPKLAITRCILYKFKGLAKVMLVPRRSSF